MKRRALWRIAVSISPEAENAAGELLEVLLQQPVVISIDSRTGRVAASVYVSDKSAFSPAIRSEITLGLERIRAAGLDPGSGRITITPLRPENWAESWKRHFKPIEVGASLLIKPSWSRRRPRKAQAVVVLDPGLSFGTGQHPTTAFCLEQIVARLDPARRQSFLDIGTGSGILSIAAAKLGFKPVHGFDFDAEAVRIARANARENDVAPSVRLNRADVTQLPLRSRERYDLVCANLISTLLFAERERIMNRVAQGGTLVLAGVLKSEFAEVRRAYESAGMKCVATRAAREWRSGAFAFAASKS